MLDMHINFEFWLDINGQNVIILYQSGDAGIFRVLQATPITTPTLGMGEAL